MLYQLFNDFPISYIKIAKDHQTRESFGYGFVGFKNHAKAEEAIQKLNYTKVGKKTIRIGWYNRESFKTNAVNNIFVKKINKSVTHKEFHEYFAKFGNVISAKLAEDEDGEVVGYGFVLYDNAESAEKAMKESNGVEWKGKKLYVGQFLKNRPKKPVVFNNIYVRNIPKEWSTEDIKKHFSRFGEFGSVLVGEPDSKTLDKLPEEKRASILAHKYAFICFKNFDSAMKAVSEVPYYKLNDKAYNAEVDRVVGLVKGKVEEYIILKIVKMFINWQLI
jgi:polyadenylate-binding protein